MRTDGAIASGRRARKGKVVRRSEGDYLTAISPCSSSCFDDCPIRSAGRKRRGFEDAEGEGVLTVVTAESGLNSTTTGDGAGRIDESLSILVDAVLRVLGQETKALIEALPYLHLHQVRFFPCVVPLIGKVKWAGK